MRSLCRVDKPCGAAAHGNLTFATIISYLFERITACGGSTPMMTSPFENYLDLVEAARLLGIHPQSLRRLIKQKKVPAVLFAGKYLIERDKLEMFKSNYDPRPGRKPIRRLL